MQRVLILSLLLLAGMHRQARGELVWEVYADELVANWDPNRPENELSIEYEIHNLSSPSDANNLIQFSVSAGTAQGVYAASADYGNWIATIQENQTVFSGNGWAISPNGAATFRIFSTHTNTAQGAANAVAEGYSSDPNNPFPPLDTLVPSEHPAAHVVRVEHAAPAEWAEVVGELGDVRINAVTTNELEVPHGAAVTVSVQRVVEHPEQPGRRLVVKEIRVAEP